MQNKRLTEKEFEVIKPFFSSRTNVSALFQVMVKGRKQADVAREEGVSRKAISQSVGRAYQLHIEHGSRPPGWVTVNVSLPKNLAEIVEDMARKARENEGTE